MQDSNTTKLLLRSLIYVKPYWKLQIVSLFVALLLASITLVNPWINKLLIDNVLMEGNIDGLKHVCLLFFGAYIMNSLLTMSQALLYSIMGGKAVLHLRADLYRHLQIISLKYHIKEPIGRTIALFTSDIAAMRGLYTNTLVWLVTESIRFCVLLFVMYAINPKLTVIPLVTLPFYALCIILVGKPIRKSSRRVQEMRADSTSILNEYLSGIREIKAFVREELQWENLVGSFTSLFKSRISLAIISSLSSLSGLVTAVGMILVIWLGGKEVIGGTMQLGVFIAYVGYMGRVFGPINTFVSLNNNINIAMGAAGRVFDAMDQDTKLKMPEKPVRLVTYNTNIVFRNVCFSYDTIPVIRNFSLSIACGESVALVGPSGSGKTTLAMLLLRFYDPDRGSISIGEVDLRELDLSYYRNRVGVVFQDPFLFNISVRDNIAFASPQIGMNRIVRAAEAANASRFILDLPNGYDTVIGERGVSLSGGQKQRIAIARVMAADPDLIIMDEATSSLDNEAERLVKQAVERLLKDRTNIVIAHRLSTIRNANRIIVVEDGSIVQTGCYNELININGRFKMLHDNLIDE